MIIANDSGFNPATGASTLNNKYRGPFFDNISDVTSYRVVS